MSDGRIDSNTRRSVSLFETYAARHLSWASCLDCNRQDATSLLSSRTFWIDAFCASVTSPFTQFAVAEFWLHRNTVIWSLLPQYASALCACALSSRPMPTRVSETKMVTITATVMDTLRLSPLPSSENT